MLPLPVFVQASDEISSLVVMTIKHKLRSFAFSPAPPRGGTAGSLAVGLATNSVEVVDIGAEGGGYEVSSRLELQGHRSDVRCLALSADGTQVCGDRQCRQQESVCLPACVGLGGGGHCVCVRIGGGGGTLPG